MILEIAAGVALGLIFFLIAGAVILFTALGTRNLWTKLQNAIEEEQNKSEWTGTE